MFQVLVKSASESPFLSLLLALSLFGWTIKQAVNVIQVKCQAVDLLMNVFYLTFCYLLVIIKVNSNPPAFHRAIRNCVLVKI